MGVGLKPVVFHRRNRKPWVVILNAEDFLTLLGLPSNGSEGCLDLTDPEP